MKKYMKKTVSLILSVVMLFALVIPAFAAEDNTPPSGEFDAPGSSDVIEFIYDVTLPTADNLKFNPDPQGLSAVGEDDELLLEDLQTGLVMPIGTSELINNSAFDVTLEIELTAAGDATYISYGENDEETIEAVKAGTANNMILLAVPSSADMNTPAVAAGVDPVANPAVPSQYVPAAKGYVISDTGTTLNFVLKKASHKVSINGEGEQVLELVEGSGHGNGLRIAGYLNPNADWLKYDDDYVGDDKQEVHVSVAFRFGKATADDVADVAGAPGLVSESDLDKMEAVMPAALQYNVRFDAAGQAEKFTIMLPDYREDGVAVYLSQKPARIINVMDKTGAGTALQEGKGYTYDAATGILKITYPFPAGNKNIPILITTEKGVDGVVYTLNLTVANYNAKFDDAGSVGVAMADDHYLEDGLVVYLSQKPETITGIVDRKISADVPAANYVYDETTGLLTIRYPFEVTDAKGRSLAITAGGNVYVVDLFIGTSGGINV